MKTFDIANQIIEICNEYPSCSLPTDGVTQEFISEELEKSQKDFGRYILQLTNGLIKKRKIKGYEPLTEETGEKLLEDLFKEWNDESK